MKKQNSIFSMGIIALALLLFGCTEEELPIESGEINEGTGLSVSDTKPYQGDIGILFDARPVRKKGYHPVKIKITTNSKSGDFNKILALEPEIYYGQLKFSLESLNKDQQNELVNGVNINVDLLNENDEVILSKDYGKRSFQSDPGVLSLDDDKLPDLQTDVYIKEGIPYYIQLIVDGKPTQSTLMKSTLEINRSVLLQKERMNAIITQEGAAFTGNEDEQARQFVFQKIPGQKNQFAIIETTTQSYVQVIPYFNIYTGYPQVRMLLNYNFVKKINQPEKLSPEFRFTFEKEANGIYILKLVDGRSFTPQKITHNSDKVGLVAIQKNSNPIRVRLVPMNVTWEVESIRAQYMQPILPPAKTGFGVNSSLSNCSQGEARQLVGTQVSKTVTESVGWQETLSLSSTHQSSVSTTLGMEVDASFFGIGTSYSAEVSSSYSYTTSSAVENSSWEEKTESETNSFFFEREVIVKPRTATLVADYYQYYEYVKVPYVQRLRVRGRESDSSLNGEEIQSQFHLNGFNGIIEEVGDDYIEITLKGTAILDGFYKTDTMLKDQDPACD